MFFKFHLMDPTGIITVDKMVTISIEFIENCQNFHSTFKLFTLLSFIIVIKVAEKN